MSHYRVVIEYNGNIYAWKGLADNSVEARARARHEVRQCFGMQSDPICPLGTDPYVQLCEVCSDLEPDQSYQDIRLMIKKYEENARRYDIDLAEERYRESRGSCLVYRYNRCIEGIEPW